MRTNRIYNFRSAMFLAVACLLQALALSALGQSAVKIHADGMLMQQPNGLYRLDLAGEASHLGRYTCRGEVALTGDMEEEQTGEGIAAFTAANGDVIVGVMTFHIGADDSIEVHFSWRDSVKFSDGTIAYSNGRFERRKPPGAIIQCYWRCFTIDGVPICFIVCRGGDHGR